MSTLNYIIISSNHFFGQKLIPFQGFQPGLLEENFLQAFRRIVLYTPLSILEIFVSQKQLFRLRNEVSSKNIKLFTEKDFEYILDPSELFTKTNILIFLDDVRHHDDIIRKFHVRPICVSNSFKGADIKISEIDSIFSLDCLLFDLATRIQESPHTKNGEKEFFERINSWSLRAEIDYTLSLTLPFQSSVLPNIACLVNLGIKVNESELSLDGDIENLSEANSKAQKKIVETIILTANAIQDFSIQNLRSRQKSDAIVYCPSIMPSYYNTSNPNWNSLLREIKSNQRKKLIKNHFIKNTGYSIGVIKNEDLQEIIKSEDNKLFESVFNLRSLELFFTTWLIANLAISEFCPAYRLPHSVILFKNILTEIELHSKRDHKKSISQINKSFIKYIKSVTESLGKELILEISSAKNIILCCDTPLEWVPFQNGIPLMISHEISKIPMTPGSLFQRLSRENIYIKINKINLCTILIVRSFRENDPIKLVLEEFLVEGMLFKKHIDFGVGSVSPNYLNIKIVDVNSKNELIEALNNFEGSIVVFDCHGSHSGIDGVGWFEIDGEKVLTTGLDKFARVPPISILSSCLTHPIAGSESSVANGLLDSGSLSVIGTFLPVDANLSGVLISRLFLAINALNYRKVNSISWRKIVSDFFKISYTSDVIRSFYGNSKISWDDISEIQLNVNNSVIENDKKWFDVLLSGLVKASGESISSVQDYIENNLSILETMRYTQLGRPDAIIIVD